MRSAHAHIHACACVCAAHACIHACSNVRIVIIHKQQTQLYIHGCSVSLFIWLFVCCFITFLVFVYLLCRYLVDCAYACVRWMCVWCMGVGAHVRSRGVRHMYMQCVNARVKALMHLFVFPYLVRIHMPVLPSMQSGIDVCVHSCIRVIERAAHVRMHLYAHVGIDACMQSCVHSCLYACIYLCGYVRVCLRLLYECRVVRVCGVYVHVVHAPVHV